MPPVLIYTKSTCPFCHAAKALLQDKAAPFEEIGVDGDRAVLAADQSLDADITRTDIHLRSLENRRDVDNRRRLPSTARA